MLFDSSDEGTVIFLQNFKLLNNKYVLYNKNCLEEKEANELIIFK